MQQEFKVKIQLANVDEYKYLFSPNGCNGLSKPTLKGPIIKGLSGVSHLEMILQLFLTTNCYMRSFYVFAFVVVVFLVCFAISRQRKRFGYK